MSTDHNNTYSMSLVDYIDSDDDQDFIEVVSNYDEKENDLIDLTKNLVFTSDDDSNTDSDSVFDGKPINDHGGEGDRGARYGGEGDRGARYGGEGDRGARYGGEDANIRSTSNVIVNHHAAPIDKEIHSSPKNTSTRSESDEANASHPSTQPISSKAQHNNISNGHKNVKVSKRKRRCWLVEEKLEILQALKSNQNKRGTASSNDCSPAQLRKWLANENKLVAILKSKNGEFSIYLIHYTEVPSCINKME
jgi:hypothetical protein